MIDGKVPLKSTKIRKQSAVDKLCDVMRELILNGTWRTNAKIPTEHELAEAFGLNRMTIRAAIQRFNVLGILETRVGDGTYVTPFNFASLISDVSDFYTSSDLVQDAATFRTIVEGGSYRLIIDNGTPDELEELRQISKELSLAIDARTAVWGTANDSPELIDRNYQLIFLFHEQLFKMTHNQLLYYAHAVSKQAVCQALFESGERRFQLFLTTGKTDSLKYHEQILAAIEAKDYEACHARLTTYVSLETDY